MKLRYYNIRNCAFYSSRHKCTHAYHYYDYCSPDNNIIFHSNGVPHPDTTLTVRAAPSYQQSVRQSDYRLCRLRPLRNATGVRANRSRPTSYHDTSVGGLMKVRSPKRKGFIRYFILAMKYTHVVFLQVDSSKVVFKACLISRASNCFKFLTLENKVFFMKKNFTNIIFLKNA